MFRRRNVYSDPYATSAALTDPFVSTTVDPFAMTSYEPFWEGNAMRPFWTRTPQVANAMRPMRQMMNMLDNQMNQMASMSDPTMFALDDDGNNKELQMFREAKKLGEGEGAMDEDIPSSRSYSTVRTQTIGPDGVPRIENRRRYVNDAGDIHETVKRQLGDEAVQVTRQRIAGGELKEEFPDNYNAFDEKWCGTASAPRLTDTSNKDKELARLRDEVSKLSSKIENLHAESTSSA